jgi:hypothetical protein
MASANIDSHIKALIVGKKGEKFVDFASSLLQQTGFSTVYCSDVYSATLQISHGSPEEFLIVGSFKSLNAENGRFFDIAAKYNCTLCCFDVAGSPEKQEQIAVRCGNLVKFINSPEQLRQIIKIKDTVKEPIEKVSTAVASPEKEKPKKLDTSSFKTTQDELDALLEVFD